MKILNQEIKECEFTTWVKTKVLDLEFSHKKLKRGRILIKDFGWELTPKMLKEIRAEIRESYSNWKLKKHS